MRRGNPEWKPGVSGNPNGRPKGTTYETLAAILNRQGQFETPDKIRDELAKEFPEVVKRGDKFSLKEALTLRAFACAVRGESWALNFIADRTEGKPNQLIDIKSEDITDISRLTPEEADQRIKELRERLSGHIAGDAGA